MLRQIPILYKNRVEYVHHLTRQAYLWAKKVPCSHSNFDQLISVDTEGTARYRVTTYPVKVLTKLNTISPEEIVMKAQQKFVDTNYRHYKTTIRRKENGLQLRTIESPKNQKPPLPERK